MPEADTRIVTCRVGRLMCPTPSFDFYTPFYTTTGVTLGILAVSAFMHRCMPRVVYGLWPDSAYSVVQNARSFVVKVRPCLCSAFWSIVHLHEMLSSQCEGVASTRTQHDLRDGERQRGRRGGREGGREESQPMVLPVLVDDCRGVACSH
jgi:hypothetical protein